MTDPHRAHIAARRKLSIVRRFVRAWMFEHKIQTRQTSTGILLQALPTVRTGALYHGV